MSSARRLATSVRQCAEESDLASILHLRQRMNAASAAVMELTDLEEQRHAEACAAAQVHDAALDRLATMKATTPAEAAAQAVAIAGLLDRCAETLPIACCAGYPATHKAPGVSADAREIADDIGRVQAAIRSLLGVLAPHVALPSPVAVDFFQAA